MEDYRDAYFQILNKLSDIIDSLRNIQIKTAELFLALEEQKSQRDNTKLDPAE